jgi:hypothetical protein
VTGGQTIRIQRAGHTLVLLGAGTWAPANETAKGRITYSDGSSRSFQLSFNDWTATTASTNSQIVTTSPSNVEPGSGISPAPVHVYADATALRPGKTVRSITLPRVNDGIVGMPRAALHVFALSVG